MFFKGPINYAVMIGGNLIKFNQNGIYETEDEKEIRVLSKIQGIEETKDGKPEPKKDSKQDPGAKFNTDAKVSDTKAKDAEEKDDDKDDDKKSLNKMNVKELASEMEARDLEVVEKMKKKEMIEAIEEYDEADKK